MINPRRGVQERSDLAAIIGSEIATHPGPEVGGLAHVEHVTAGIAEQVHPRAAGQGVGELEFGRRWMAAEGWQFHEVIETQHAQSGCSLEQQMQQISGGPYIVEGPMTGLVVQHEVLRQGPQFAVRDFVTHQSPGQTQRVHHTVGELFIPAPDQCRIEETQIETYVVPHDDGVTDELE